MSDRESVDQSEHRDTAAPAMDLEVTKVSEETQLPEETQVAEVVEETQVAQETQVAEGTHVAQETQVAEGPQVAEETHIPEVEQPTDKLEREEEIIETSQEHDTIEPLQDFESPTTPITPSGQHSSDEVRLLPARPTHLLAPDTPSAVETSAIERTGTNTRTTDTQGTLASSLF